MDAVELIEDLGTGRASVEAVRALEREQAVKRLLMLKILHSHGSDLYPEQFVRAGFASGLETLARLQASHPSMVGRLLHYPGTGAWLGHCLRRLKARSVSRVPLWTDLGYIGWLAAAARVQAGEFGSSPIVIREGHVMLPGIGLARVGSGTDSCLGEFLLTTEGFEIQDVRNQPSLVVCIAGENASWMPLRRVMVPGFDPGGVVIDDADPFLHAERVPPGCTPFSTAVGAEDAPWQALLLSADRLLETACQAHRAPVTAWLRVVQPTGTQRPGHATSDTSPESFGSVVTSMPRDAAELARTLVHECQHAMLGALEDCVPLTQPASGRQFFAPWVEAMRPARMLLQGAYAHLGVAAFCRGYGRCSTRRSDRQRAEEESDRLAAQVFWALSHLRIPGVLTGPGAQFVDRLLGTAADLRVHGRRAAAPAAGKSPAPLTATMLAAYFDLCSEQGPLHARATADLGRRLLEGSPFPPYQVVIPAGLRAGIAVDCPDLPALSDPRQLPVRQRSGPWSFLCTELDQWDRLNVVERLRATRVLARLGFWTHVASLPIRHDSAECTLDELRLIALHCRALRVTRGATPELSAEEFRIQRAVAADPRLPVHARLSAAVNATVMHGRSGSPPADVWESAELAQRLAAQAPPGELSDLLLSAYWRGISFAPLAEGNHRGVAEMLQESEGLAVRAVTTSAPEQQLLSAENLCLVLETRGQAAELADDAQSAGQYFAELTYQDPLDARCFVRLGDFYLGHGEFTAACHAYRRAALLGAPHTAYARGLLVLLEDRPWSDQAAPGERTTTAPPGIRRTRSAVIQPNARARYAK